MLYFVVYYPVFKTAKVVIFCKKEGWGLFFLLFDREMGPRMKEGPCREQADFLSERQIYKFLCLEPGLIKPVADGSYLCGPEERPEFIFKVTSL